MLFPCCSFIEVGSKSLHVRLVPQKQFTWQLRGSRCLYKQMISMRQISFPLPECGGDFKKPCVRTRVILQFKCGRHSRSTLPSKGSSLRGEKGDMDSILRSLESASEIRKVLHSLCMDLSPKDQTVVLREQRSCERLIQVWNFFKSLENYAPNVVHYNVVFRALGRARKWDDLIRYWIEMAKNDVLPTNNTYSTLIDVCGKAGLVKEALLWIKHMKLMGMFPDEITMNTVVKVLKDAREFDWADKFYKDWCMGWLELDDLVWDPVVGSENGLHDLAKLSYEHFLSTELHKIGGRPESVVSAEAEAEATFRKPTLTNTYNTLIDLYGKAGRLEDAARVFFEMLRSGVRLDVITFNTMIFTCGSHGHLAEAEALLKEMELRGISPDVRTYNSLLSLYADSGNITAALDCYRKIRKVGLLPSVVTYRAVIHILCERNMVQEVEEVLEEMEESGPHIDEHSLPALTKMYVNLGQLNQAKDLLEVFQKDREMSPNVCVAVMKAFAEKGYWAEAEALLKEMELRGISPDVRTYNSLLSLYADSGNITAALDCYRKIRKVGILPSVVTYRAVIQILCERNMVQEVEEVLEEMEESGARIDKRSLPALTRMYVNLGQPNQAKDLLAVFQKDREMSPKVCVAVMKAFAEKGYWDEAEALLKEMELRGISPDVRIYNSLLSLYADSGNITAALDCYRKIRKVGLLPSDVTYRAVIHILCERNMVPDVEEVLEEMEESGARIDEHSLPALTRMYVNLGQLNQAKDLLEVFQKDREMSPKVCAAVMDAFAEKGLWAEAESMFLLERTQSEKDVSEYNVMIKAYGMAKHYEKAFSLFKSMKDLGTWPDECTYDSVIQMLAGGDLVEAARDTLEEMKRAGFKPLLLTFSAVIACYARLGDLSAAVDIYHEMQRQGVKPNGVVYCALINGFTEVGRFEDALQYVQEMRANGIRPNHTVLNLLIKAYGSLNSADAAKTIYEMMKSMEGGLSTIASTSIIKVYMDLDMVSEAEQVFNDMLDKGLADAVTFTTMMAFYHKMAMYDKVIEVAEEMKQAGFLRDCYSYNEVMTCYRRQGMLVEVGELLYEMLSRKILPDSRTFNSIFVSLKKAGMVKEAIKQLQSSYLRGKPYSRQAIISCLFAAVGLDEQARESCRTILNVKKTLHLSIYNACIYILGALGETDDALNVVRKMRDKGVAPDAVTYIHMLPCYVKAGMIGEVHTIHGLLKRKSIKITKCLRKAVKEAYRELKRDDLAELFTREMILAWDQGTSNSSHSYTYYEVDDDDSLDLERQLVLQKR